MGPLQLIQMKTNGKKRLPLQQVGQCYEENITNRAGRLFSYEVALKARRKPLRIGTWSIRTLYKTGKLDNAVQEMNNMNLDVM